MFRIVLVLLAIMAAALGGTSAARADFTCTGIVGGGSSATPINDNVRVPNNATCTLNFVNVRGNVEVGQGSTLLVTGYSEPSTIGGNVLADHCYSALLEGNVTVGGSVLINQCSGNGPNGFQGPDTVINGNFLCQGNSSNASPCLAWLGKVGGDVQILDNGGVHAPDVSLVNVGGNLLCRQNSVAATHTHGPSWVAGISLGECASFATSTTSISNGSVTPAASCAALAGLPASGFPVPNVVITSAVDTAASGTLPERCIVSGYINRHASPVDTCFHAYPVFTHDR